MTKEKLLELYKKLKQNEINAEFIEKLKYLKDEEIDIFLKSTNKKEVLELMKNENFNKLSKNIKQELISIINNCYALSGKLQHILNVATNKIAISSNQIVEICTSLSKAKGIFQTHKASLVACNLSSVASNQVLDLVEAICNCKDEEQANIAYCAAVNPYILRSGQVAKIVNLVVLAKDSGESLKIYYEILNSVKDIKVTEALSTGQVYAINFWEEFIQNSEETIKLLELFQLDEEITPNMLIYGTNSKTKTRKRTD